MNLRVIKCPNCNANISLEESAQTCQCEYCGSRFVVEDGVIRVNIKNQYVDEARVREVELQQKQLDARLALLRQEREAYEIRRKNWTKWLIAILVIVALSFIGTGVADPQSKISDVMAGTFVVASIVGGIALVIMRPKAPEDAQKLISGSGSGTGSEHSQFSAGSANIQTGKMEYGDRSDENMYQSVYSEYKAPVSRRNRKVALFLCICFGFLGAHHFYCGRYGKGILYLLTLGLCYIGWIYDIIMIASGKYRDGDGLYVR